jgi:hypothetical protein
MKSVLTGIFVTSCSLFFSLNVYASITEGLVAYYPFEDNTVDVVNQTTGVPYGDVTYTEGYAGKAVQLDGIGDSIDCGRDFIDILDSFTATAWVKTTDARSEEQPIFGWHHSGFLNGWFLEKYYNTAQLYYGGDGLRVNSNLLINDGAWHFLAVSYDAEHDISSIQVDQQIFERIVLGPPVVSPANFVIGGIVSGINKVYFNGSIDEVRIYNRILTEEEIAEIIQVEQEPPVLEPAIAIDPIEYDFGNVAMGNRSNAVIAVTNSGGGELVISSLEFQYLNFHEPFSLSLPLTLPITLESQSTLEVELVYAPSFLYTVQSNNLIVTSNAPDEAVSLIPVWGIGVLANNPSDAIKDLLNFINFAVKEKTILPIRPGKSKKNRIKTLKNMIRSVGDLLDDNNVMKACDQLESILKKVDGSDHPPDFVTGTAVSAVADGIRNLMSNFTCEPVNIR